MNRAIILAGGTGTRLGANLPKQYIEVNHKTILMYAVEEIAKSDIITEFIIVADREFHKQIEEELKKLDMANKFAGFALPGQNRQLSIYNGLLQMKERASEDDFIMIHDGARPLLSEELISACFDTAHNADGALPVLPMKDTVYYSESKVSVDKLLERSKIYAGQAPEVFRYGKYLQANESLLPDQILQINGSTEPAILAGMDIAMLPGDENNYKITTQADLERFIVYCNR